MTIHRLMHEVGAAAPAGAIRALLADPARWPELFPRVVHVDPLQQAGSESLVRLWTVDPAGITDRVARYMAGGDGGGGGDTAAALSLRLIVARPPVAGLGCRVDVEDSGTGGSRIVLTYEFEIIADDPDAIRWYAQLLDQFAEADLATLREAVQDQVAHAAARFAFADRVQVDGPAGSVYEFLDRAEQWPGRLGYVDRAALRRFPSSGAQSLVLETREPDGTRGEEASARILLPERGLIVHKQLEPGPLLRSHVGRLLVEPTERGATASWQHTVVLSPTGARELLGPDATLIAAMDQARRVISARSLLVLGRAKSFAEGDAAP